MTNCVSAMTTAILDGMGVGIHVKGIPRTEEYHQ